MRYPRPNGALDEEMPPTTRNALTLVRQEVQRVRAATNREAAVKVAAVIATTAATCPARDRRLVWETALKEALLLTHHTLTQRYAYEHPCAQRLCELVQEVVRFSEAAPVDTVAIAEAMLAAIETAPAELRRALQVALLANTLKLAQAASTTPSPFAT